MTNDEDDTMRVVVPVIVISRIRIPSDKVDTGYRAVMHILSVMRPQLHPIKTFKIPNVRLQWVSDIVTITL